jgi:hypothetical protein
MSKATKHWDKIYQTKDHTKLSWSQTQASISLDWILNYTNKKDTIIMISKMINFSDLVKNGVLMIVHIYAKVSR